MKFNKTVDAFVGNVSENLRSFVKSELDNFLSKICLSESYVEIGSSQERIFE